MGCLFSWTRNESRLFFQNYRLRKEVTGRKCSEVETFEWRAGFKKDGLSIAGFLKDNRPARLICTWTLLPNYFFSVPSHSRVFRRKGQWPKRRKEGECHIYLHEGFLNSLRAAGSSSKGEAVNFHGDGMYYSEKRGAKYYSVW